MVVYNVAKAVVKNAFGIVQYPSFVTFIVTWRCNGKCIFCDVWKQRADDTDEMTPEQIEGIFSQLRPLDVLRISGGEPFLRKDLADIVNRIDAANRPGMIHFTTNGVLTDRIVNTMQAIQPVEKIHLKVSIDHVGEKHDQIRGMPGAYDKAMQTVKALSELRQSRPFHLGVNQTIADEQEIDSYFQLQEILKPYDVPIYPVIASDATNGLYSNQKIVDPDVSVKTFGNFSEDGLKRFMRILLDDGKAMSNLQEQMVDRYHLKGLYNRLVEKRPTPNPKCVALNNHLRILPNGDVPVCLYNGTIVGNLVQQNFQDLWFGESMKAHRDWVKQCPGCWQSCESAVSAIYTGDIWKGLFS